MNTSEIIQEIAGKDWWERKRLIELLLGRPEAEYIHVLETGVRNHENANVRNAAMEIYESLGRRGLPSIITLVRDPDHEVRLFAVNMLHQTELPESLPVLMDALNDEDVNVRIAAVEALGRIGDSTAIAALQKLLSDEPWVAMAAVAAIGEIGGDEAVEALSECLGNEQLEEIALEVLRRSGTSSAIGMLADHFESSADPDTTLRAIINIAEREKIRPHAGLFRKLLPHAAGMLQRSEPGLDRDAFIALCWSIDEAALPYMIKAIQIEDLQEYAIEGLLDLGDLAVSAIVAALTDTVGLHRLMLAKVLSMLGAHSELLRFAGDDDAEVRTEVALALADIGGEESVETLKALLDDRSEEVRLAARRSLDALGNPD